MGTFHVQTFFSKVEVLQEGRELLPRCNMCEIHMPEGRLIKHHRTTRCFKNTEMRIRHRGVEVASFCSEMELRLTGEEVGETIEEVALFKCLGKPLDKSYYYWPEVRQSIRKVRQVWGGLGVILRWEGAYPITPEAFYIAVEQ